MQRAAATPRLPVRRCRAPPRPPRARLDCMNIPRCAHCPRPMRRSITRNKRHRRAKELEVARANWQATRLVGARDPEQRVQVLRRPWRRVRYGSQRLAGYTGSSPSPGAFAACARRTSRPPRRARRRPPRSPSTVAGCRRRATSALPPGSRARSRAARPQAGRRMEPALQRLETDSIEDPSLSRAWWRWAGPSRRPPARRPDPRVQFPVDSRVPGARRNAATFSTSAAALARPVPLRSRPAGHAADAVKIPARRNSGRTPGRSRGRHLGDPAAFAVPGDVPRSDGLARAPASSRDRREAGDRPDVQPVHHQVIGEVGERIAERRQFPVEDMRARAARPDRRSGCRCGSRRAMMAAAGRCAPEGGAAAIR